MIMSNKDSLTNVASKIDHFLMYFFGGNHSGLFIALMFHFLKDTDCLLGFPAGTSGKEPTCQCRRCRRLGFDPWARKIPWRKGWKPTPVFLPGESHGQKRLVGYSSWVRQEWDMTEVT